ncbi:MAG TPA: SDR family oxidoreductase [Anaerolineae bacterium]|nr:SDR family oxidoreductase [Anaerolineae bacterium]
MKIVVITGSTRGIGYGLADAFLDLDCAVTISGRSQEAVDHAVAQLSAKHAAQRILGCPCNVREYQQVQALWETAKAHFGQIDIWVNNAGIGHSQVDSWELSPEQLEAVVGTNVLGTMFGSKVAVQGMLAQGFGAIYNMEGLGSRGGGPRVQGTSVYAASKAGLRYFDEMLAQELRDTPLILGTLNPGMVATELVTSPYDDRPEEWERARRIFNIIADRVETVAPWLARQMLDNQKNGVRIAWSSWWKVTSRFLAAPFRKRDLFDS